MNTNDSRNYVPYESATSAFGAEAVNRSSIAALAFLVWDILITFDDEVKLIWPRPSNHVKYLYFFVRYIPVLVQISILLVGSELTPHFHFTSHDCYIWQVYQGVAAGAIALAVDVILILRVHALYHRNKFIHVFVSVCYAVEIIGMGVGLGLGLPGVTYDNICVTLHVPNALAIYAGSAMLFQAVLFFLTAWRFIHALRSGWGDVPLIVLLMRDGTWAFFLLFFAYIANLSTFALQNGLQGILYGWLITAFSFSGYRILLNLNKLGRMTSPPADRTTTRQTDPDIQFSTQIFSAMADGSIGSYELSTLPSSSALHNPDTTPIQRLEPWPSVR